MICPLVFGQADIDFVDNLGFSFDSCLQSARVKGLRSSSCTCHETDFYSGVVGAPFRSRHPHRKAVHTGPEAMLPEKNF